MEDADAIISRATRVRKALDSASEDGRLEDVHSLREDLVQGLQDVVLTVDDADKKAYREHARDAKDRLKQEQQDWMRTRKSLEEANASLASLQKEKKDLNDAGPSGKCCPIRS